MSQIFVIPDIHLKPWMLDEAEKYMSLDYYDYVVMLGDFVDDWGQERNLQLYSDTLNRIFQFVNAHNNIYLCYGNHDLSYKWEMLETGYSAYAHEIVVEGIDKIREALPDEQKGYIHRFDNVLFSHGGLTDIFVKRHHLSKRDIDEVIKYINSMGKRYMWCDVSPIWARPQSQYDGYDLYPNEMIQVVGHTPVKDITQEGNLISVDVFSTYSTGKPYGCQKFISIDSVSGKYIVLA